MKKIKNIRKKNLLIALFFPILILASGCFQVKKQAPVPAAGAYKSFDRGVTWQPKRNLEDSIRSLVKWYSDHPQGWNKNKYD